MNLAAHLASDFQRGKTWRVYFNNFGEWGGEMAQWMKVPAAKPDNLSWISGTYRAGGGNRLLQPVL